MINYGDIFILGNHRLMCGDATNRDDVQKLMQDNHAKILFTSPPYSDIRTYNGCNLSIDYLKHFIKVAKDFSDILCVNLGIKRADFSIIPYWDTYIQFAHSCGLKLLSWNVWDKLNPGSIGQASAMFPIQHEFIFVFGEKPIHLNRTIPKTSPDKRLFTTRRQKDGSLKISSRNPLLNETHKRMGTVCYCNPEKGKATHIHPAAMPIKLPAEYIKALTNYGDCVLDPFGGSGTTLIACEQLNRKCFMMEISPNYCQIIIDRWQALSPIINIPEKLA